MANPTQPCFIYWMSCVLNSINYLPSAHCAPLKICLDTYVVLCSYLISIPCDFRNLHCGANHLILHKLEKQVLSSSLCALLFSSEINVLCQKCFLVQLHDFVNVQDIYARIRNKGWAHLTEAKVKVCIQNESLHVRSIVYIMIDNHGLPPLFEQNWTNQY